MKEKENVRRFDLIARNNNGNGGNGSDGNYQNGRNGANGNGNGNHTPPTDSGSEANDFLVHRYPQITEKFGSPLRLEKAKDGSLRIKNFNDDFFAAVLGWEGPTVFLKDEKQFYCYSSASGVYEPTTSEQLKTRLSDFMYAIVKACPDSPGIEMVEFDFRKQSRLNGVIDRAKGLLTVPPNFFEPKVVNHVVVKNGVLRLSDRALLPFDSSYKLRRSLQVRYEPNAHCPRFMDVLLRPAMCDEDIDFLQRWCGLVVLGRNLSQVIMVLVGTSGGGKGTWARICDLLLGPEDLVSLRTSQLEGRFELGRMLDRTLVYAADVPADFLNTTGACILKAIVGGDPVAVELKGSNARPKLRLLLNVLVTTNVRLRVRQEGGQDPAAWRRRLRMIQLNNPPPTDSIHDLSEQLFDEEGPGILNWALDGLAKLQADNYNFRLSKRQQNLVDDLLAESDSVHGFVKECLRKGTGTETLTVTECYTEYLAFCSARGWHVVSRNEFGGKLPGLVNHALGVAVRNDILAEDGKHLRGFRGLVCEQPKSD